MVWLGIALAVFMFVIFVHATEKLKYGEFNDSSWGLLSFGIYVWGQGVLLAPFWILFGLACIFWWTPSMALTIYIWFHMVRALVEILLIRPKTYLGLAALITPASEKITVEQKLHLYALSQALVIICGIILVYTS